MPLCPYALTPFIYILIVQNLSDHSRAAARRKKYTVYVHSVIPQMPLRPLCPYAHENINNKYLPIVYILSPYALMPLCPNALMPFCPYALMH